MVAPVPRPELDPAPREPDGVDPGVLGTIPPLPAPAPVPPSAGPEPKPPAPVPGPVLVPAPPMPLLLPPTPPTPPAAPPVPTCAKAAAADSISVMAVTERSVARPVIRSLRPRSSNQAFPELTGSTGLTIPFSRDARKARQPSAQDAARC